MIAGLSDPVTITLTIAGIAIFIGLFTLARIIVRREPNPPHWARFRFGVFIERDHDDIPFDEGEPPLGTPFDEEGK